ncbi:ATP-binding protein [Jiulongibacter sediminis]|uniref:histidine kinase n=1 Tax=Jiulongibacter sediminis TaxID=1605367 RepID=A0A0P7BX95_9BACT|nr:ATP-binding protein [Jiulongibacter sediminis]KPM46733.1 hypothetical protein AFM12_18355 [Jiulongibacter sediminis]TBX21639.1 hypothetical protein TK44_18360 [Jiulongibacter sediminis]
MNVKSIVYDDIVNLENCESEPIHVPGSIQPHGILLAVDTNLILKFCSQNLETHNLKASEVLEKPLKSLFSEADFKTITELFDQEDYTRGGNQHIRWNDTFYSVLVHKSGDYHLIELEKATEADTELTFLNSLSFEFARHTGEARNLKELCQRVSEHIKEITGYDRVMIYKFDQDYNGEVFAEAKEEKLESFLGLHYPHTDIPPQARALYMTNLVRMISDVHYKPVPVLTLIKNSSHRSLDMSMATLRSVSPIHVSYLQNMGVGATLTISLIHEEKLWGLVACHHYSPKHLSYYGRVSSLLQGQLLASQIRVQETAVNYEIKKELEKHLEGVQQLLRTDTSLNISSQHLLELCNADGFICQSENQLIKTGDLAGGKEAERIFDLLKQKETDYLCTRSVSQDLGIETETISGILFFKIDVNTYAMWLRKEFNQEIEWAGNPNKAIEKDKNGLSPRKSFKSWKEIIKGQSRPWTEAEKDIAKNCVYLLQKHFSYLNSQNIQKKQEDLLNQLQQANEELENINWISAHDLKEPLRKIRIFSSILTEDSRYQLGERTLKMIDRINNSASRMQRLLDDLMELNRTKHVKPELENVALSALISEIIEHYEWEENKKIRVAIDLPVVKGNAFLLTQLFTNLIDNSIKFAKENEPLIIDITWSEKGKNKVVISLKDNGQGFENKYAENMFKVFHRLNDSGSKEGSGVGLAICKKVVELHGGEISAQGIENKGATFNVTLLLPEN